MNLLYRGLEMGTSDQAVHIPHHQTHQEMTFYQPGLGRKYLAAAFTGLFKPIGLLHPFKEIP